MNAFKKRKSGYFILCLAVYVMAVIGYAVWSNHAFRAASIHEIDQKLALAARGLKFMLAPDFHDRAVDSHAISFDEEMKNRAAVSGFTFDTDIKWAYTLAEKDGKFYFSAPTVTAEEAREKKSWYFLPYDDIPQGFVSAFENRTTVFSEYRDQWGHFRSVAIAEQSPGGRTYLACADYEISYLEGILLKNQITAIATAIFFFLGALPLVLFIRHSYRAYSLELRSVNAQLNRHKTELEELVEARTAELKRSNRRLQMEIGERESAEKEKESTIGKLQEALSKVKQLSGLLPICAACKKIRDDKGYWNQIEAYIHRHSEAEFSHGICPECAKKLYPEFDVDDD